MSTIKVKVVEEGCMPVRSGKGKSDCFDLTLAETVTLKKGELYVASLGVAMEIPKGMSARMYLRSSSPVDHKVMMANHVAVMDYRYNGDDDIWRCELIALKSTVIPKGTRICQFELVSSQFATRFEKFKWLFGSKPTLKQVMHLGNKNRGGIGSTTRRKI